MTSTPSQLLIFALALCLSACATPGAPRDAAPGDTQDDAPECVGATVACGSTCVNTSSDPLHCGACNRRCVIQSATTGCRAGECFIAACDPGTSDDNGSVIDGCEGSGDGCTENCGTEDAGVGGDSGVADAGVDVPMDTCMNGTACTTSCGTTGMFDCAQNRCNPPAEQCNLRDDNCDGSCDPPSCLHEIHRANGNGHYYTDNESSIAALGYTLEARGYYLLYNSPGPGLAAFHQCRKGDGRRFYSLSPECEGQSGEGIIGYIGAAPACGSLPLYRLYGHANHFYTTSEAERDNAVNNLGYTLEGVAGYVWSR